MDITRTLLPGVGLRYEFTTRDGQQLGVVAHASGQRDLLVYDRDDPDACRELLELTDDESEALAELLGAARIVEGPEKLRRLTAGVTGLAIDWLPIRPGSPYATGTIADTRARTLTGVSIVAVLRDHGTVPAPAPDFRFVPGDTLVVVGTGGGVRRLAAMLDG